MNKIVCPFCCGEKFPLQKKKIGLFPVHSIKIQNLLEQNIGN